MAFELLNIDALRDAYASGEITPQQLIEHLIAKTRSDPHCVWIHRLPESLLQQYAAALAGKRPHDLPLYGIPFAIKDNIDLAGAPTSAACPEYSYWPERNAFVVQRLIDAGAIPIGKTNMDQFATGLNGTRSPYGACLNAFDSNYISGGSSSGSAVAVALGYASFALGTDTAGSGRVPAAFNNLIGHKPTRGWLSTSGTVPACRSLDCVSIFALTAEDAERVLIAAAAPDAHDPFSRQVGGHGYDFGRAPQFRLGVPAERDLEFFGDAESRQLFGAALQQARALGAELVEIDFHPFLETAKLLYEGPWLAERYMVVGNFIDAHPQALLPVTRGIIEAARRWSAGDVFRAQYKLAALKQQCDAVWRDIDAMLTPTAGTIYSIAEVQADPLRLNSHLGYYTNFMNLLDYAATALPAGFLSTGLPFGVTLFAPAHQDAPLLHLAARWQRQLGLPPGTSAQPLPAASSVAGLPSGQVRVAVCGAHMRGLPLNWQLTTRGARLVCTTRLAPLYKLYALPGGPPLRPGMVRVGEREGGAIELEIWELPAREFGSFVAGIPAPLGIGTLILEDRTQVQGFVCESAAVTDAEDITRHGGWRAFLHARA
jgi:allophanate hydrolase